MKQPSYIFVGKPSFPAQSYEFGDRERKEFSAHSLNAYQRIVQLCQRAGYPRFNQADIDREAQHYPRIHLTV